MSKLPVGAHLGGDNPLEQAEAIGASAVQIFLSDPQSWRKPKPRPDADDLKKSSIPVFVHAPYLINVASPNNKVRIPSRKILQDTCDAASEVNATAVIVHAGHSEDDIEAGFDRWRKALEGVETDMAIYIENTAGGNNAMGRRFDVIAKLWEVAGPAGAGFCLDTCHAHAAGEDLSDAVERILKIVGKIDLVHANDSRDAAGSGADRHTNLGTGNVGPDVLRDMVRACNAPVICETPGTVEDLVADLAFVRESLS